MGLLLVLCVIAASESEARRTHISPEQHHQLSAIHTVYLSTVLLSSHYRKIPVVIQKVVVERLRDVGMNVVLNATHTHDVEIRVTCEEEKSETPTTRYGGDAELAFGPDRLWLGAACRLGYRLKGQDLGWYQEVRTNSDQFPSVMKEEDRQARIVHDLAEELKRFDFPVFLLSEWGQTDRLIALLRSSHTTLQRKQLILKEFRFLRDPKAEPVFLDLMGDNDLRELAIGALAGLGTQAIPYLHGVFEDATYPASVRAAAAKGLGQVGLSTGDARTLEPLLKYLIQAVTEIQDGTDIEFPVMGEVVWAVGQVHHDDTFQLIEDLQAKLWMIYDTSPEMRKLRETVSVVYKYVDLRARIL